jgi:peptidoglycan lytic transglycosylase
MVRRDAASFCLASVIAFDILLIGAAGMWPKTVPSQSAVVAVPLEPPPPAPSDQQPTTDAAAATPDSPDEDDLTGVASWYGDHWQGRTTASGKPFDERKLTAAHRTLPLNTRVRVTNLKTGLSVEVTITDRGPYAGGRVIDLSKAAAKKLGMVKEGLVPVRIENVTG